MIRSKLGILAGGGELPSKLAETCVASGRGCFVIAYEGQADAGAFADVPHAWIRLGAAGAVLDRLAAEGVEEVVMAGRIRRPRLSEVKPDAKAVKILLKVSLHALGDNGLLSALAGVLEDEGFRVIGVHDVMPEILAPEGVLGRIAPDEAARADIAAGFAAARDLGRRDQGQAAIVRAGKVLGLEDRAGTDALIARCAAMGESARGAVLIKALKPGQDRRIDLPAIGTATVENAAAAGLAGIAVEAGHSIIVDRENVIEAANGAGLFVVGVAVAA